MFDESKLYVTTDPALRALGTPQALAHWRHRGCGPPYVKLERRVAYRGADLNAWLAARTVRPSGSVQSASVASGDAEPATDGIAGA